MRRLEPGNMSMELTPGQLEEIAHVVSGLSQVAGFVRQVEVAGHTVILDKKQSGDGTTRYVVRGITDKPPHHPVTRERS
jgi:hypothetical protein